MNIERKYFRRWKNEASDSSYYILPYGDDISREYGRAVCEEKYMKIIEDGSPEYAAQCKEIVVSDAIGTKFTHIITNVVSDSNDDSYYDSFRAAGINSRNISLDHMAETREQAIHSMEEMADGEEEIGGGFNWDEKTYTLEEFKRIMNSSDTLTEEQLECFRSVYCDYQGFGYFRGVAFVEDTNESLQEIKNESKDNKQDGEMLDAPVDIKNWKYIADRGDGTKLVAGSKEELTALLLAQWIDAPGHDEQHDWFDDFMDKHPNVISGINSYAQEVSVEAQYVNDDVLKDAAGECFDIYEVNLKLLVERTKTYREEE